METVRHGRTSLSDMREKYHQALKIPYLLSSIANNQYMASLKDNPIYMCAYVLIL